MRLYDARHLVQTVAGTAPATTMPPGAAADEPADTTRVTAVNFSREPLWAYGFTSVASAGDKAQPQALPTNRPRPNEDLAEQTAPRQAAGAEGPVRGQPRPAC
jgi:hypothetical protein